MVRKIRIKKEGEFVNIDATRKPDVHLQYDTREEPEGTALVIYVGEFEYRFNRKGKLIHPV
jgi:hypothetical protein